MWANVKFYEIFKNKNSRNCVTAQSSELGAFMVKYVDLCMLEV